MDRCRGLKLHFAARRAGRPAAPRPGDGPHPRAGVLIAATRPDGPGAGGGIVMTVRSERLRRHAGQISLPGGACDADDRDLIETAVREAGEEVGIRPERLEVVGVLEDFLMPSGIQVTPVVGIVDAGARLVPCPEEVADIFTLPLEKALDPAAYARAAVDDGRGGSREVLELRHGPHRIWGATAAILHRLAADLGGAKARGP